MGVGGLGGGGERHLFHTDVILATVEFLSNAEKCVEWSAIDDGGL